MNKPALYVIPVPRKDIENKDIQLIKTYLKELIKAKARSQCIEILISGYDESTDEVYEIKDIRDWTTILLKEYPELLYYTSLEMGTTIRLLASVYDVTTISPRRMNAHEAREHLLEHGDFQQQPVFVTIPELERMRLYAAIKSHGIKCKDVFGANQIVSVLKQLFDK